MIVTITTSGGIGGFGLGREARVETDTLPQPLRAEVCERLDPETLQGLAAAPASGADRVTYHLVIEQAGQARRRFDLPETALPPETLDVIDEVLSQSR